MRFKTEHELQAMSPEELEKEKSRVHRIMKSPRFSKDPKRQLNAANPTDPNSPEVEEPTQKQLEDYLSRISQSEVEKV